MPRSTTVAVVGGGIGGLAAALALLRAGFDVRVYEQSGAVSQVGAGIQLAPNCTRILHRLGVLPAIEKTAFAPTTFDFRRWDDGRLLSRTPLGAGIAATYGAPYLHAHRSDLVAVLADAVGPDRVETGRRCSGVNHDGTGAEVLFADGGTVAADVVVGADGIHSVVREALYGPQQPRFTGHVAYRGLVPADRLATWVWSRAARSGWVRAPTSSTTSSPPGGCTTSCAWWKRTPGPASRGPTPATPMNCAPRSPAGIPPSAASSTRSTVPSNGPCSTGRR